MAESRGERWFIAPYSCVPDVVSAANYYRDILGFSYDRFWGEPPAFCMVKRRGVIIMLAQVTDRAMLRPGYYLTASSKFLLIRLGHTTYSRARPAFVS